MKRRFRALGMSRQFLLICSGVILPLAFAIPTSAEDQQASPNKLVIEVFVRPDSEQCQKAKEFLKDLSERREGIEVKIHDVTTDKEALARLWKLAKQFGKEKAELPTIYFCNSIKVGFRDAETTGQNIESYLTIRAFVRTDCPHCDQAKAFLKQFAERWPAIKIEYLNVVEDANARDEFEKLTASFKKKIISFPCLQVAGRLVVGFQDNESSGKQIEDFFLDRSESGQLEETNSKSSGSKEEANSGEQSRLVPRNLDSIDTMLLAALPTTLLVTSQGNVQAELLPDDDNKKKLTS